MAGRPAVHGRRRRLHGHLGGREQRRLHRLPAGVVLAEGCTDLGKACTANPSATRRSAAAPRRSRASRSSTTTRSSSCSRRRTSSSCARMADAPSVILPKHLLVGQTLDQINKGDFKNKAPDRHRAVQAQGDRARPVHQRSRPTPTTTAASRSSTPLFYKAIKTETALAQLESGELDVVLNAGASNFDRLSKVDILNVQTQPGTGHLHPGSVRSRRRDSATEWNTKFKLNLPPVSFDLSDKRVRQAIYYAIDRRDDQRPAVRRPEQDPLEPARASRRLPGSQRVPVRPGRRPRSSWPRPSPTARSTSSKTIRLHYATDLADSGKIAPIVKQQLEAVGFKVELNAVDIDTYNTLVRGTDEAAATSTTCRSGAGGSEGLSPSRSQIYFKCGNLEPTSRAANQCRLLQLRPARPVPEGPDPGRSGRPGRHVHSRSPRSSTTMSRQLYLWQLAGVHAVNKRVQGLEVAELRALRHHRRRELVRHPVTVDRLSGHVADEHVGARRSPLLDARLTTGGRLHHSPHPHRDPGALRDHDHRLRHPLHGPGPARAR